MTYPAGLPELQTTLTRTPALNALRYFPLSLAWWRASVIPDEPQILDSAGDEAP
jgi:hypothetical protein